jgi:hypothetical protein
MARGDYNGSNTITMNIGPFGGVNNEVQFSQIGVSQSPDMANLLPGKTGSLKNREGTAPVTQTPQAGLKRLFPYRLGTTTNLVASAGTTLYKYDTVGLDWDAQTMTNVLVTADINAIQYRDDDGDEVLVIADGGHLKSYNGTAVTNITPAANDADPLPANDLSTINADFPPIGVTVHNNRLVIWSENSDTIHHSKPGFYDYFPNTSFQRFVNNNDYVQTCISFGSSLIVFMRNHVAALFGDGYSTTPTAGDWAQDFLDTTDGCVNGRSVQIVVFPNGKEEVFYQTDRGVSSVLNVDTKSLDNSTRFATRDVTANKVAWNELGVTNAEWSAAVSYYHEGFYWLVWKKGSTYQGMVYSTENDQWYPINNVTANDFYSNETGLYFITEAGHLTKFDETIYRDYTDYGRTVGDPVSWYWYSKLLTPGLTGHNHLWDILMVETRQFADPSTIDVEVNTFKTRYQVSKAIKTQIMIIGFSVIGQAEIANQNLTDIVNNAKRLRVFGKGQYSQIKLSSDRGEPVELYQIVWEMRPQVTYG